MPKYNKAGEYLDEDGNVDPSVPKLPMEGHTEDQEDPDGKYKRPKKKMIKRVKSEPMPEAEPDVVDSLEEFDL